LDILERPPKVVDCGACPVTMACAIERGGTGWTFDCCHSTSVEVEGVIHIIDCQRHKFEQNETAKDCKVCPLCTGDVMVVALRDAKGATTPNRYVPTKHAKVSLSERLRLWKKVLPEHREREGRR